MKKDGTMTEKLHDGYISHLNIVGNWIYFLDRYRICKIKTDGSGYQTIADHTYYWRSLLSSEIGFTLKKMV